MLAYVALEAALGVFPLGDLLDVWCGRPSCGTSRLSTSILGWSRVGDKTLSFARPPHAGVAHGPRGSAGNSRPPARSLTRKKRMEGRIMPLLFWLWLLGVPLSVVVVLWLVHII